MKTLELCSFAVVLAACQGVGKGSSGTGDDDDDDFVGPQCHTPSASQIDPGCFPDELGDGPVTGAPDDVISDVDATIAVTFNGPFVRTIDQWACVVCDHAEPKPVDAGEYYNCDNYYRCGDDACRFHVTVGGFDDRRWKVFGPEASELPASCRAYAHGVWDLGPADIAPWVCEPSCTTGLCGDDGCGHSCPCSDGGGGGDDGSACSDCYDACSGIPGCSCCAECDVPCWND